MFRKVGSVYGWYTFAWVGYGLMMFYMLRRRRQRLLLPAPRQMGSLGAIGSQGMQSTQTQGMPATESQGAQGMPATRTQFQPKPQDMPTTPQQATSTNPEHSPSAPAVGTAWPSPRTGIDELYSSPVERSDSSDELSGDMSPDTLDEPARQASAAPSPDRENMHPAPTTPEMASAVTVDRLQSSGTNEDGQQVQPQQDERAQGGHDDLTTIEGIGPKVNRLLRDAGITSFAQLAGTDVERLRQLMRDAGLQMLDPATWPQQARLAQEQKWEELGRWQQGLKGGRRE